MRVMSREEEITSNYMEVCLYNKTKEIENKIAEGKTIETDRYKYKDVFRTEVKIKNNKLNANKDSGKEPDKAIETYYNNNSTTKLYNTPVEKLFGKNDFFRIDKAFEIIKQTKMRKSTKIKLIKLLIKINTDGYTEAKKYWVKRYSEPTFRSHIKKIEALGINVLTFDKEIDGIEIETEKIKNFTSLKNTYKKGDFNNENNQ